MLDWKSIAALALKYGAPVAGGLIAGNPAMGAKIGGVLADLLGVEPTPEAVSNAIEANPATVQAFDAAMLPLLLKQTENEAALIESEKALRLAESQGSAIQRNWRPLAGYTMSACAVLLTCSGCALAFIGKADLITPLSNIGFMVMAALGSVCTMSAFGRTKEKIAGVA
jgi:hypothetical protein